MKPGVAISAYFIGVSAATITSCEIDGVRQRIIPTPAGFQCVNNATLLAKRHLLSITLGHGGSSTLSFDGLFYTTAETPAAGYDAALDVNDTQIHTEVDDLGVMKAPGDSIEFSYFGEKPTRSVWEDCTILISLVHKY